MRFEISETLIERLRRTGEELYAIRHNQVFWIKHLSISRRENGKFKERRVYKRRSAFLKAICAISSAWYSSEQEARKALEREARAQAKAQAKPVLRYRPSPHERGCLWAVKGKTVYRFNPNTQIVTKIELHTRHFNLIDLKRKPRLTWFADIEAAYAAQEQAQDEQ